LGEEAGIPGITRRDQVICGLIWEILSWMPMSCLCHIYILNIEYQLRKNCFERPTFCCPVEDSFDASSIVVFVEIVVNLFLCRINYKGNK